tara:strand:- start:3791 stop:4378 length:588 start_codon:yes stop_codon:yes gene_type:complete
MAQLPHINTMKFGIIDQTYMNTLAKRSDSFAQMENALSAMVGKTKGVANSFFALIKQSEEIAEYMDMGIAWKYDWRRVEFIDLPNMLNGGFEDGFYTSEAYDNGALIDETSHKIRESLDEISGDQAYAYNMAELTNINTQPIVFGIDMSANGYPEGYTPQSVPENALVYLTKFVDTEGRVHFFFERQGTHDGECE